MDDAIGTLLDALDRFRLVDRTILIFTSDNGGNMYNEIDGTTPTSNAPLRGGKATVFEGGTRVPCVIAWPGITRPGSRSGAMIQSEDYYPTLLAGLGLQPAPGQRFDGLSILSALKGGALPERALFQYFPHNPAVPDWLPPAVTVHRGDWKLIRIFHGGENGAHRHLLFNLRDDLSEKNNLAAQQPERVRELEVLIEHFLEDTKAVVPLPNPAFDPAKYHPEDEGKSKPRRNPPPAKSASAAIADPGDHPQMQGWKTRGCAAVVKDGIATITGTGAAPFLGFAPGKLEPGAKLRFRIKCDGGSGQVAWLPAANANPANAPKPAAFSLKAGAWAEISATIPAPGDQAGIVRLFLPAQGAAVELDWIELISGSQTRRWDF
jgi:hypothetical protein